VAGVAVTGGAKSWWQLEAQHPNPRVALDPKDLVKVVAPVHPRHGRVIDVSDHCPNTGFGHGPRLPAGGDRVIGIRVEAGRWAPSASVGGRITCREAPCSTPKSPVAC
jgi:hypothetical protein